MSGDIFVQIILSALSVVVFWSGIAYLISLISGWSRAAKKYPDSTGVPFSDKKNFRTMTFGHANYSFIVTVEVSPIGLRISVLPLFRPGHKPILFPWSEIDIVKKEAIMTYYEIIIRGLGGKSFRFGKNTGEWIMKKKMEYGV